MAAGALVDPLLVSIVGGVISAVFTGLGALFAASLSRNVKAMDATVKEIAGDLKSTSTQVIELAKKVAVLEYQVTELRDATRHGGRS